MGLTALTLHNYRSFAAPTRVAVRPLTLVFGRNSAGKSALLRALPLLAASFHEGRMLNPLAMGCEAMREATFRDLLCQVGGKHSAMEMGLAFEAGSTETSLRVRLLEDSRKRHFVEHFWLSAGDDARVSAQWRLGEPLDHFDLTGTFGPDTLQAQGTVHPFAPVVPQVQSADARWAAPMRDVFSRVQQFAAHCQWLGSLRTVPARRRRFPLTRPTQYGASGDALLDTLAWDTREEAELPHLVSAWYEKHFQMRLRVTDGEPGGESFRLRLGPVDAAHDVDVCDTGEGMAQALPVVTALYQSALASAEGAQTLALEQPSFTCTSTRSTRWPICSARSRRGPMPPPCSLRLTPRRCSSRCSSPSPRAGSRPIGCSFMSCARWPTGRASWTRWSLTRSDSPTARGRTTCSGG